MKDYEAYDLLFTLQGKKDACCLDAAGAELICENGGRLLELNEMRLVLGQKNQAFQDAMKTALDGVSTTTCVKNHYKDRLYQYLDETTGGDFCCAHLTSSGSEAAEWAVRIAQKVTGRHEIVSFWNSIHGRTYLSASMSGLPKRKAGYGPLAPGVVFLPYPEEGTDPEAWFREVQKIYRYGSAQDAAAVIVEPYQGAGLVFPQPGCLKLLETWAHENGMLFILDETQSAMGRTGEMYAYQKAGLCPDMLILGKGLGNGFHIAALLSRVRPPRQTLGAISGGSGDDVLCCAAACEVFRQLEDGLLTHIREVGAYVQTELRELKLRHAAIKAVQGSGLAASVCLSDDERAEKAARMLRGKGCLAGHLGARIFFRPPYVLTQEQAGRALRALDEVLCLLESEK